MGDGRYRLIGSTASPYAIKLRALMRFFAPVGMKNGIPAYPPNPWQQTFQAGTRLSAGLDEARRTFVRAGVDKGSVILVSDLADAEDPSVLADSSNGSSSSYSFASLSRTVARAGSGGRSAIADGGHLPI